MQAPQATPLNDRLLPLKEICKCPGTEGKTKMPVSYATYHRLEQRGEIEPAIEIGGQKFNWESKIDAYLAKQEAAALHRQQERLKDLTEAL